jgi:hypothetical protein
MNLVKVKVNSNVEKVWFWLMGNCYPADLGNRPTASPGILGAGSEYQGGMGLMKEPKDKWPCWRFLGAAQEEEMRKDMMAVTSAVTAATAGTKGHPEEFPIPARGGLERLVRVFVYVYAAI